MLPAETDMGVVEIAVHDLAATSAYYRDTVGLSVLDESVAHVTLGTDAPLIRLVATTAGADDPRTAGLCHSAILYPDAASLAEVLANIAQTAPESFQGSADHAVSIAFSFGDPEGNGLELYIDRPRDEWVWEDGLVQMGSAFVDVNQFIVDNLGGEASGATTMGHVHLREGDLDEARAFYADALGFDVTAEADGALFYSAGGYHHHIATNTWMSEGAGQRPASAGLAALAVTAPDAAALEGIAARLDAAGVAHTLGGDTLVTVDPWGTEVRFLAG